MEIVNPLTNRKIAKDGATHKKLIKEGVLDVFGKDIRTKKTSTSFKKSTSKSLKRPCGPTPSKANPDAYSKEELVNLTMEKLGFTKSQAMKMKKEELCTLLKLVETLDEKEVEEVKKEKKEKKSKPEKVPVTIKKSKSLEVPEATIPVEKPKKIKGDCIKRSKLQLLPHQIRVVEYMKSHRGLIMCHSMGSGKTLTAIASSQCYLDANPKGKIMVVTPVSLQGNFKKEMVTYGVRNSDRYEFYTFHGFLNTFKGTDIQKEMAGAYLIIDEVHNLRTKIKIKKGKKTPEVTRSYILTVAAKFADKVLLLTGTPFYNEISDIKNLVEMVTRKEYGKTVFKNMFVKTPGKFQTMLNCLFSFYTNKKNEFYPSVKEEEVHVKMSESYFKKYIDIEDENSEFYNSDPFAFYTGVRMACNDIAECIKCDFVMGQVRKNQKILIYSAFKTKGLELLKKLLKEERFPYYEITGKTPKDERTNIVNKYNAEEEGVKILMVTKAGGEGLDLKGTRIVEIFESTWNRPNEEQIIARAVRYMSHTHLPENERNVTVHHLLVIKPDLNDMIKWVGNNFRKIPSADIILQDIVNKKIEQQQLFIDLMAPVSIEQNYCP